MTPSVPDSYREALRGLANPAFLKTAKWREQQWRAIDKGGDPQITLFCRLLVRGMAKIGVPMFTHEIVRSAQRQAQLYNQGFSRLTSGPHMTGTACDVVHSTLAWNLSSKQWDLIGHVGKEIIAQQGFEIKWGGEWKTFHDPAHWEREDWHNVPGAFTAPF